MNIKALWVIVIVALIGGAAWYAFARQEGPSAETPDASMGSSAAPEEAARTVTVTYTDAGFSPRTVTVSAGDTVRFVNESSNAMWVGSDDHPTHTEYDGTSRSEHCPGTASFDQCASAGAGGTYEFTFEKAGTFGYHNHVRAADSGTVIVE